MKEFKIRCSAIGKIMTNPRGNKEGLSETTKSYCDMWLKEQLYNRKYEFTSKYTDKGIIVEDNSIDFIAHMMGFGFLIKNETFFEDEYMTGTPDLLPVGHDLVIDVKNSWSWETFPLLEEELPNKDYYGQLQGYMNLTTRKRAKLLYILSDTPEHLIEREARRWCYTNGYDELDMDIYEKYMGEMTYPDVEDALKIKSFDVPRSDDYIAAIKDRVMECREYIAYKLKSLNI